MIRLLSPLLLFAAPVGAQGLLVSPLNPSASAIDNTARQAAADAMAAAQSACQPTATIPPTEVPGGTTGSGTACRLANSANNRISRTGVFTITNGQILCGGSTTCTWATALPTGAASYPIFFTAIGSTAAPGVKCKVTSTSNTGFIGAQCVQSVASVSVLGANIEIAAATGTQVFVLSLPSTQASQ